MPAAKRSLYASLGKIAKGSLDDREVKSVVPEDPRQQLQISWMGLFRASVLTRSALSGATASARPASLRHCVIFYRGMLSCETVRLDVSKVWRESVMVSFGMRLPFSLLPNREQQPSNATFCHKRPSDQQQLLVHRTVQAKICLQDLLRINHLTRSPGPVAPLNNSMCFHTSATRLTSPLLSYW